MIDYKKNLKTWRWNYRAFKNIVSRNESLENQARSAQTNGTATSYINTIVNSKSITEAISRVAAMSEIVSANNKMLEQQKEDKKLSLKNKLQTMMQLTQLLPINKHLLMTLKPWQQNKQNWKPLSWILLQKSYRRRWKSYFVRAKQQLKQKQRQQLKQKQHTKRNKQVNNKRLLLQQIQLCSTSTSNFKLIIRRWLSYTCTNSCKPTSYI